MDVDIRLAVYEDILETGRVPTVHQLATRTGLAVGDVSAELRRLQEIHAIALAPVSDEILMAFPFSAVPTPHVVRTADRVFWANCAWDALSIPSMLTADATVESRCGDCGEGLHFTFETGRLLRADAVVHFAVPPREFWHNVVYT